MRSRTVGRAAFGRAIGLAAALGVGCATAPQVVWDVPADFDGFRTWDWLSSPPGEDAAPAALQVAFDRQLRELVERELERRGFARDAEAPELRIGLLLDLRREIVTVSETGAVNQLSSLHSSPSYQIQASMQRQQAFQRSRLAIFAADPQRRRIVWRGAMEERFPEQAIPDLESSVAQLLEHFPRAGDRIRAPASGRDPWQVERIHLAGPTSLPDPDLSSWPAELREIP